MALCQFLKWLLQVLRVVFRNQFVSSKKTKASSGYERCHNWRDLVKYVTNPSIPLARLFYSVDCVGSYFSVAGTLSSTARKNLLGDYHQNQFRISLNIFGPFCSSKIHVLRFMSLIYATTSPCLLRQYVSSPKVVFGWSFSVVIVSVLSFRWMVPYPVLTD